MTQEYDVFLSFKNLESDGARTRDCELADEIYRFLTSKGLSVFFSNISLEKLGIAQYKQAIDDALDAAHTLVAIGTSADHLNSQWVKYEWDSFFNDILSGVKPKGRVFAYIENEEVARLPRALRQTQTFSHGPDSLQQLCNFIVNTLGKDAVSDSVQPAPRQTKCPRCLAVNTMVETAADSVHPGWVQCNRVFESHSDYRKGEMCGFEMPKTDACLPSLTISTVGTTMSGKSRWLFAAGDEIHQGNLPDGLHAQLQPGPGTRYVEYMIDGIRNHQRDTEPSLYDMLSDPVPVWLIEDAGAKRTERIAYVMDFSGEAMQARESNGLLVRPRLISSDGFVFLLDLTQPMERQRSDFAEFFGELRLRGRSHPELSSGPPVAICVTKLDLVFSEDNGKLPNHVAKFRDRMVEIDSTADSFSVESIRARSDLTRDFLANYWPGWKIGKQAEVMIGSKHQFFPICPPGIAGSSHAGETSPYRVLEPLIWLLNQTRDRK